MPTSTARPFALASGNLPVARAARALAVEKNRRHLRRAQPPQGIAPHVCRWVQCPTGIAPYMDLAIFYEHQEASYTRHVLFFGAMETAKHVHALTAIAGGQISVTESYSIHDTHKLTRLWGDADIDALVQRRAKKQGAAKK